MKRATRTKRTERVAPKGAAKAASDVWELKLYVAGETRRSVAALANLKNLCEEHVRGPWKIEVVDLLKHILNWRQEIRSSRSRPWYERFRSPFARSLATCRIPRAPLWDCS